MSNNTATSTELARLKESVKEYGILHSNYVERMIADAADLNDGVAPTTNKKGQLCAPCANYTVIGTENGELHKIAKGKRLPMFSWYEKAEKGLQFVLPPALLPELSEILGPFTKVSIPSERATYSEGEGKHGADNREVKIGAVSVVLAQRITDCLEHLQPSAPESGKFKGVAIAARVSMDGFWSDTQSDPSGKPWWAFYVTLLSDDNVRVIVRHTDRATCPKYKRGDVVEIESDSYWTPAHKPYDAWVREPAKVTILKA